MPRFGACCARSPGLRQPAADVAWHLSVCLGCSRRRASLACLVAPCGALRLVRSGRSRCSSRLSRCCGAFPQPGGLGARLYWAAARGTQRPAVKRAHCACRWPPPRQGRWALFASYPFGAPRWGWPWRVPLAPVLGCVRCAGWRVWTRSLMCLVSRTVRRSTGDLAGAPGLFCVDANTSPCGSEDARPGSCASVRVLILPGQVGRASLPGAFWCASPFPLAALSFGFAGPRPGWSCPCFGPLFALTWPLLLLLFFLLRLSVQFCLAPPLSLAFLGFRPRVPWALAICVVSFAGITLLGSPCALAFFVLPCPRPLPGGCPPPPPCYAVVAVPRCLALVFFFPLLSSRRRPPCPRSSVFSGPGCPGPWRWFVSAVPGFPWSVFFFCLPPLDSSCALACFLSPGWPVVVPRWLLPPPPPSVSCGFGRSRSAPPFFFFFFLLWAPPLSLAFSGLRPVVPWAWALCFVCFSRLPAARLSVRSCLVCVSRLAVGRPLVVVAPPPLPFGVSPFSSLLLGAFFCFFFPLCAHVVSGFLWFPAPGALGLGAVRSLLCWPAASRLSVRSRLFLAFRLAVDCSLVVAPPPPFVSRGFPRCRSVLCAVCCAVLCVPWCIAAPRCCALCRPVLCCPVLCCFVALVSCRCLLRRASWRCPSPWGPVLCGAVLCGVPPRCVLCAACVLSWRGGACCFLPLCFVLCVSRGAMLCLPCPLRSVQCCASLCWCACVVLFVWCVLLLAPGAVVRCCMLCCFLWCAVVRCWVWGPVVVCWWPVSVSVSLSGRVVCFSVVGLVCCGALLPCVVFCGAVLSRGAVLLCSAVVLWCCWGLLCPPVACCAVLCCAVGWLCCFLPGGGVCVLWCSFPRAVRSLFSPLCALRCLVVLAVVPCVPVSCAVAQCCRVVLCCRVLLSLCGAVCVCFALLWPVVRRRAVLCCAVGCLCCFFARWWRLCAVVPFPSLPARTKNINYLTCHPALLAVLWLACLGGCGVLDLTRRTFHLQRKGGESVEGGAGAGGEGTWRKKEGVRDLYRGAACFEFFFSCFTRCSRRSFLYVDGVLDGGGDGVMFLLALRCLWRYLFVYLGSKFSTSCLNAFRRGLFALSVFYAI